MSKRRLRIQGLIPKIRSIKPDIVQTFDCQAFSLTTYEAALAKPFMGYKLFLESHLHASVFPPATEWRGIRARSKWLVYAATLGRLISVLSEKCYPVSIDAAEIVIQFFGVQPEKVEICSLGVDTELFSPVSDETSTKARLQLRQTLGFSPSDIVCVYTGRFSDGKNPLCLAQAIDNLVSQGYPFRGLFVGRGPQAEAIQACQGSVVHPFVSVRELPSFYRAADIGVWPKQESTSQLDAAACGLPLIVSNQVTVRERIEGNGLLYKENEPDDLARQIYSLFDPAVRERLGRSGTKKVRALFSWEHIARQRIQDYEAVLRQ